MIQPIDQGATTHYRTIWLSDLHLGIRASQAECVLHFLKHNDAERIYLVGDIVDGWQLRKNWHWDQNHNNVVQKLLRKSRKGAEVTYIPGNHDQFARDYVGVDFGGIKVCRDAEHVTADGRRLLVLHGDEFDGIVTYAKWLAVLGGGAYVASIALNRWLNVVRHALGLPYWSLSAYLKHRVKNALTFMADFEQAVADEARRRGADGVVCGHIHHAVTKTIGGIEYFNTGDWVESCTALVEHFDGRMEILHWTPEKLRDETLRANRGDAVPVEVAPSAARSVGFGKQDFRLGAGGKQASRSKPCSSVRAPAGAVPAKEMLTSK